MKRSGIKKALRVGAFFICAAVSWLPVSLAATETARVAQVLDGDSLRLTDGRELRLIGINAPEHGKNGAPDEPLAREARAALARLTTQTELRLEYDTERKDHYQRELAHVFLPDGRSVQELLLRDGLAFSIAVPPNLARLATYRAAETEARSAGRGVWGHSYYKPRDAAQLGPDDTGFRLVEGRVQRVARGPRAVYIDLGQRLTLVIPDQDWHYFGGDARRFLDRRVRVRGWVTAHNNQLRLRLSNPAMWELLD